MELTGVISNGHVLLDGSPSLPEGARVIVRVVQPCPAPPETQGTTLGQRLRKHAGTVSGLPSDLAEQQY